MKFRDAASFGKRQEYVVIAEIVEVLGGES